MTARALRPRSRFDRLHPVVGGLAFELGQIFDLEKLCYVLRTNLRDERAKRVEPRPIKLGADLWLEVDGYVGVGVLVCWA